jgi:nuclear transport factor 2 (NTF2) superfamily protein
MPRRQRQLVPRLRQRELEFDEHGRTRVRRASINDLPIRESDRK